MKHSFDTLCSEHRPMVIAYLSAMGADPHLAEDLAQEAFLAAHQSFDQFQVGGNFSSWIRGIARNKALMHWRSAATKPPLSADARSVQGIDEVFEQHDPHEGQSDWWGKRREILKTCVENLSKSLNLAIQQVYTHGDNLEEAALALNSSRLAIGQRLSRARNQIRKCVQTKLNSTSK